jgi:hypothetical protein
MPAIHGINLVREVAAAPYTRRTLRSRFRNEALDLVEREKLIDPVYSYRIVPLDAPQKDALHAGGETLDALRLVPERGQLTAVASGVCTLGPALERRTNDLCAERRMSLALALDEVGNDLLFALSRRLQDRIVAEARRHGLSAAGELRAGDPGLPLQAQAAVHRLCGGDEIGVRVTEGQVLHPLKSVSMLLGIGIDLPPATWSRCDDCPSAEKCRMSGRAVTPALV